MACLGPKMICSPTKAISKGRTPLRVVRLHLTSSRNGYTLMEMLFVMVLIGIIMGIGVSGFDRVDPGYLLAISQSLLLPIYVILVTSNLSKVSL